MTNMFDTTPEELTIEAVKEKYDNDPEKAWEALLHSQNHIVKIESENTTYKANAATSATLESVLEALKGNQNSQSPPVSPNSSGNGNQETPDIKQLVAEYLASENMAKQRDLNKSLVIKAFQDKWKDKSREQFATVAAKTGFTPTELEELAARNPTAVIQLAGLEQVTPTGTNPSKGGINPQALNATKGQAGKPGTKSYWDKFRAEKPNEWSTIRIQDQIRQDFDRDPEFFLNN